MSDDTEHPDERSDDDGAGRPEPPASGEPPALPATEPGEHPGAEPPDRTAAELLTGPVAALQQPDPAEVEELSLSDVEPLSASQIEPLAATQPGGLDGRDLAGEPGDDETTNRDPLLDEPLDDDVQLDDDPLLDEAVLLGEVSTPGYEATQVDARDPQTLRTNSEPEPAEDAERTQVEVRVEAPETPVAPADPDDLAAVFDHSARPALTEPHAPPAAAETAPPEPEVSDEDSIVVVEGSAFHVDAPPASSAPPETSPAGGPLGDTIPGSMQRRPAAAPGDTPAPAAGDARPMGKRRWLLRLHQLRQQLDRAEHGEQRVELLLDIAEILDRQLGEQDAALAYWRRALIADPINDRALVALERIYRARGEIEPLVDLLLEQLDLLMRPRPRAELLSRVAALYEGSGELEKALVVLQAAQREVPHDERIALELDRLRAKPAVQVEVDQQPATEIVEQHLAAATSDEQRLELLHQLATLHRRRGESSAAVERLYEALEIAPTSSETCDRLAELHAERGEQQALAEILERRREATPPRERGPLHARLARLYNGPLDRPERALDAYRALRELDGDQISVLEPLARLCETLARWEELADVLRAWAAISEDPRQHAALIKDLAALYVGPLAQPDQAIELYREALRARDDAEWAIEELAELCERLGRWEDLAETLSDWVESCEDDRERSVLLHRLARLHEEQLDQPDRAIDAYRAILDLDPQASWVLDPLEQLCEAAQSWEELEGALRISAKRCSDRAERCRLLRRLARLQLEHLDDAEGAQQTLQRLLARDPDDDEATEQLWELYRQRADWPAAAELMLRSERAADKPTDKARAIYRAALVHLEQLSDPQRATELLRRALAADPDHVEAARALAGLLVEPDDDEELQDLVGLILRKGDADDAEQLHALHARLGRIDARLGQLDRARVCYEKALAQLPGQIETLDRLAELLCAQDRRDDAIELYRSTLRQHGEQLSTTQQSAILLSLARCRAEGGDAHGALGTIDRQFELRPDDPDALRLAAELRLRLGDVRAAISLQRRLVGQLEPPQRRDLLLEIGDLEREKLHDATAAAASYDEAHRAMPGDRALLHRLLEVYSELGKWERSVAICEQIATLEKTPALQSKFLAAAAVFCRDEIGDDERALQLLQRALDADPTQLDPLAPFEKLCAARGEWRRLERCYTRLIERSRDDRAPRVTARLWDKLGKLLVEASRDLEGAIAAFEAADRLDPGNPKRRRRLARCYASAGGTHRPAAIKMYHELIASAPKRIDAYHGLYRLYREIGAQDPAWCLAGVLCFLRHADSGEQRFYRQGDPAGLQRARSRASDGLWHRHLFHAEQDRYLSALLALLAPALSADAERPHADFELRREDRRDLANDQLLFSRVFSYVWSVLMVAPVDLYLRPEATFGLMIAYTTGAPSFVVGAQLLQDRTEREIAFAVARQLSYVRPELALRYLLTSPAQLRSVLAVAYELCGRSPGGAAVDRRSVDRLAARLAGPRRAQIAELLAQLGPLEAIDLDRWWLAAELTADRVGLLVCADLELAAAMINAEPPGVIPARRRVRQLVQYACSRSFFLAREQLGLRSDNR